MNNVNFTYTNLTPFKWYVLENFPFIEADFDVLTNWQLLCKLGKEMNKIINSVNLSGEQVEKLTQAFIKLQTFVNNFFENLDVQEEINNKLDELVSNGTLANILNNYVNITRVYNTHEEMISDTTLVNNQKVKTLGFYNINDGGGAYYFITDENSSTVYQELTNTANLYARLITNEPYPEMFGAYGDGINNDQTAFDNLIKFYNIMYLNEKNYKITSLTIKKDFIIYGNNATILGDTNVDNIIQMTTETERKNLKIYNLNVDASHANCGIYINKNNLLGQYIKVTNALECCIHIIKTGVSGSCNLNDVTCHLSEIGLLIDATDCKISHYHGYNCMTHIKNNLGLTHIMDCHGWNFNTETRDWITGSTLIETNASLVGIDIYVDTLENGILLPTGKQYTTVLIQNLSYFLNTSSYPTTQQHPTVLKNHENYEGYCRIDGLYGDENGWKDSGNNYPILIDNIDLSKISITNVTNSGFRFGRFKPMETIEDIQVTSYNIIEGDYVSFIERKVKYVNYDIHCFLKGSMNTGCPDGQILSKIEFIGQQLNNLSIKSRITAKFVSTSTPGLVYNLSCSIDNGVLTIYNDSGTNLGGSENYGNLYVYIDDFNQN